MENKEVKKNIVVNYIAAKTGGAYTILDQFLDSIKSNEEAKTYNWIVFVSSRDFENYRSENVNIIVIDTKGWFSRIYWDLWGMKRWLQKRNIKPYKYLSLQNTGVPGLAAKQYIYLHQPLILARGINLKWFEYKMIFYRFVYRYSVKYSIKKDSVIFVQTEWMKNELFRQFSISSDRIVIIKPEITINHDKSLSENFSYKLFYPAVPHASYKNHELLIKSIYELKKINPDLYSKIEILFTTTPDYNAVSRYYNSLSKKLKVDDKITWCGYLNSNEMEETYLKSDITLFPSKLESLGLPLIEAAYRKRNIFTLDNNFSHELLDKYKGVTFLQNNPVIWAKSVEEFYLREFLQNIVHDEFKVEDGTNDVVQLLIE